MWVFTTVGFFSVVEKFDNPKTLVVRARVRTDLDELRKQFIPKLGITRATKGTDYPYRATCSRSVFSNGLKRIVKALTYKNFKSEVRKTHGLEREHMYHQIWSVMYNAEKKLTKKEESPQLPMFRKSVVEHLDALEEKLEKERHEAFPDYEPKPLTLKQTQDMFDAMDHVRLTKKIK